MNISINNIKALFLVIKMRDRKVPGKETDGVEHSRGKFDTPGRTRGRIENA